MDDPAAWAGTTADVLFRERTETRKSADVLSAVAVFVKLTCTGRQGNRRRRVLCVLSSFTGASISVAVWFLKRMEGNVETEVGPLRPNELLSLVRKGQVQPDTMLRKDDSAWFEARTVGGLFEAALRQEVQY